MSQDGNVVDLVKNSTTDYNLVYSGTFDNLDCGNSMNVASRALEYDAHDQTTNAYIDSGIDVMTVLRCALGGGISGCDGAVGSLVDTDSTQTLTHKTLTAPILSTASLTGPTISMSSLLMSPTAPMLSVASGFGTSASISASNGTAAFQITAGTLASSSGTITLPTAANGWACSAANVTRTTVQPRQTGSTVGTATLTNFNSSGTAVAWTSGDKLNVSCHAF